MKEYGSDFHYIDSLKNRRNNIFGYFPNVNLYADGRQCVVALIRQEDWKRLWVPEYFCYEVIQSIREQTDVTVVFYEENPLHECILESLPFKDGDALLRMNYFGIRDYRSNENIPVQVIEDHSHDLMGHWATNSDADWCIASLRKTLPIPEGGMLWSPHGYVLPSEVGVSAENEGIAAERWEAMQQKARYLAGEHIDKKSFREGYVNTESYFDRAPVCALDKESQEYLKSFDIKVWYDAKRRNWRLLSDIKKEGVHVLLPENDGCCPFSLIMIFNDASRRKKVREELIALQIYPAVLWDVPSTVNNETLNFSRSMLSIHCDARYSTGDILEMKSIIESIL